MYLVGFALYVALCVGVAWGLAVAITYRARESWPRRAVAAVLAPIVLLLPLADEIVGYFQFERLCEEAKVAKIYGTIPVGEDLYTPEGKWRIGLQENEDFDQRIKNWDRAQKALDSYVRWDSGIDRPQEIPAAVSIQRFENKIYDVKTERLLAEWMVYNLGQGWLSRTIPLGEFSAKVCGPDERQIQQTILRFTKSLGATK
jgi:hypothetical protein